jgi:shikimate kinase
MTTATSQGAHDRIVLVGFMGSGKSTVGPILAARLGWRFVDMDRVIEARAGCSVREIFERAGEGTFRAHERAVAEALSGERAVVVSAGGGAFAFPETRRALATKAVTVWLRCRPDTIETRVGRDPSRPLARDRERMLCLLTEREPSYRMADAIVDTDAAAPAEIAERVLRLLSPDGAVS